MTLKKSFLGISQDRGAAIIALSSEEVGKIISTNTKDALMDEAEKLQYANSVNDLLIKFKRMDKWGGISYARYGAGISASF